MNSADGAIEVKVYYGLGAKHHHFTSINAGETQRYDNSDWKTAGLCWDYVKVKRLSQWSGCPAPQFVRSMVNAGNCSSLRMAVTRSGCGLQVDGLGTFSGF